MLAALAAVAVDLVLPRSCVGCGCLGVSLCRLCGRTDLCIVPGASMPVVAASRYEGGIRRALIAYKERDRRDLAVPLGSILAVAVAQFEPGRLPRSSSAPDAARAVLPDVARAVTLVPVPSSAAARRARGGDHVARLGRAVGGCASALRLVRAVRDSAGLDVAARAANLHGAMRASPPRRTDLPAVIIDDITTTGATLTEAARALQVAGWAVVGAAVVAATERRYPVAQPGLQRVAAARVGKAGGTSALAGLTSGDPTESGPG